MRFIFTCVCLVACVPALRAQDDVITLQSGGAFTGRIQSETAAAVTLDFSGGSVEFKRNEIKSIVRGAAAATAPAAEAVLASLNRYRDLDDWYFLYRAGRRVGWRSLAVTREIREGVAGYARRDRVVFTRNAGAAADVDLVVTEFLDADGEPRSAQHRVAAGSSTRLVEAAREGAELKLVEQSGGRRTARSALFQPKTVWPGFLMLNLARDGQARAVTGPVAVFDPRSLAFSQLTITRRVQRVQLSGRLLDVLVLHAVGAAGETSEVWFDMLGHVVREEIGGGNLVALRADGNTVRAWRDGARDAGTDNLGLEISVPEAGMRVLRPDQTWEVIPGAVDSGNVITLGKAAWRATAEVFEILDPAAAATDEAAVFAVSSRLGAAVPGLTTDAPRAARIGALDGLRLEFNARRAGTSIRTLGFVVRHGGRLIVTLCAAPADHWDVARPCFLRLLESLRITDEGVPDKGFPASDPTEEPAPGAGVH